MLKKNERKKMQSFTEINDSKHNVDEVIRETFNNIGQKFVLVSKIRIKTWKSFVILAFVAGAFGVLMWSVSKDEMGKIYLAGEETITNQASLTFKDSKGNVYGPVFSNVVTTTVTKENKIKPIKIKIKLEGKQNFASQLTLYVLRTGTENIVFQTSGTSGSNGKLEIDTDESSLPAGVYDFKIKIPNYLSKKVSKITWPSEAEIEFDDIIAGNLQDSDNIINSLDWSLMSGKWGTNDQKADINNDGIVNTLDWSLMNKNWGKTGM
ncbi:MAG: Uncharacterized protein Athens101410_311 [Parcubacteria group bacterium Athens1014_10]|nr:MAG: Uncharacterized protein Athens101410_311 [Parcubacteria group bacterium Athens1014_10]TSD05971.1 MAG: Uncharacterized protein Athens071412_118 [Parcubacteria group bacterium Athens0714_12]